MIDPITIDRPGRLGILSLDTQFPRPPGDVGCPESYPFAVEIAVVDGSDSPKIVQDGAPDQDLIQKFIAAAQDLEARGACAIVSTCGFLVTSQHRIASCVTVPVMLSALSLGPLIQTVCPGRTGILTASAKALGPNAIAAAGLSAAPLAIAGMEDVPEFADAILVTRSAQPATLDQEAIERAAVAKALRLQAEHGDLSAMLLECGNLPPYAGAVGRATGLPVFHMLDAAIALVKARQGRADRP